MHINDIDWKQVSEHISALNLFSAICIDTSVYDGLQLGFEAGLLKSLEQFVDGEPARLVMPEVVLDEVRRHTVERADISTRVFRKAVAELRFGIGISKDDQSKLIAEAVGERDVSDIARGRVDMFIERTGTKILKTAEYVDIEEVQRRYFDAKPPFAASGEKKSEFPDAFALLSLEAWAEREDRFVLVVSKDGDWRDFCLESRRLHAVGDLAHAIGLFAQTLGAIRFARDLKANLTGTHEWARIEDSVRHMLWELSLDIEASSDYAFDDELIDLTLHELSMVEGAETVVESSEEEWILEVPMLAEVTVEVDFRFSVRDSIDRDYLPMGGSRETMTVSIPLSATLTFAPSVGEESPALLDYEFLPEPVSLDFGYVRPKF